ncbi:hypothetical protein RQM59_06560 [Flavobacteriaceae bacterium S356]|uniref:WYL domain-containing protein n=1 Tax=Asprobacillus argus TaxID=3076534 RepID=A0ABU3LEA1_9FLAO|nr:hypothetical protein [Flavobacteriaceae bacterium S356]
MIKLICEAIFQKKVIQFYYDGELRIVEPHCYGITTAGNQGLRAYQIDGYSSSGNYGWKMYDLGKAVNIEMLTNHFFNIRDGYKRSDKGMSRIYCEI